MFEVCKRMSLSGWARVGTLVLLSIVFSGLVTALGSNLTKITDESVTLDPGVAGSTVDLEVLINVYEPLVWYDGEDANTLVPWLATKVPTFENGLVSENGMTITIPIRQGVKFHNGKELTAEDVKYTFDRILIMAVAGNYTYRFLKGYLVPEKIKVLDPYTVEFTLEKLMPSFVRLLTLTSSGIVNKAYVEEHGGLTPGEVNLWMRDHACATGPFTVETWVPNERIVLKRFDGYWREPAKSETITFLPSSDISTEILMLKNSEADIINMEGKFSHYDELASIKGVRIQEGQPRFNGDYIVFNMDIDTENMPPSDTIPSDFFKDINVRYGFIYAFPFDLYMTVVHAHGNERYVGPIPQGMLGDNPDLPLWQQDLAKAETYFKRTEWWDKGFTITMLALVGYTDWERGLLMFKDALEALNPKFHVNVQPIGVADILAQIYTKPSSLPMYWWGLTCKFNDPDSLARPLIHSKGSSAYYTGYSNPSVDQAIDEAFLSYDSTIRDGYYQLAEQLAYYDPPYIWIDVETSFDVIRDNVKGFVSNPVYDGWYLYSVYKED